MGVPHQAAQSVMQALKEQTGRESGARRRRSGGGELQGLEQWGPSGGRQERLVTSGSDPRLAQPPEEPPKATLEGNKRPPKAEGQNIFLQTSLGLRFPTLS